MRMILKAGRAVLAVVDTLKEASAAACKFRDENDLGSRTWPLVTLVEEGGRRVGFVSYNGRIWDAASPKRWTAETKRLY